MLPVAVKFIERRHVREWGRLAEQRVPMEIWFDFRDFLKSITVTLF